MSELSLSRKLKGKDFKQIRDSDVGKKTQVSQKKLKLYFKPNQPLHQETPDFNFIYNDTDSLTNELAEWYTYTEEFEFELNRITFEKSFIASCKIK